MYHIQSQWVLVVNGLGGAAPATGIGDAGDNTTISGTNLSLTGLGGGGGGFYTNMPSPDSNDGGSGGGARGEFQRV